MDVQKVNGSGLKRNKPVLEIKVEDTGTGISADRLPHIFDRYYQVDDSATRRGEGTGIGLALVRELLVLMNGAIRVESGKGKGSTFTVLLPVEKKAPLLEKVYPDYEPPEPAKSRLDNSVASFSPNADQKELLLIVEDNPDVTHYLQSITAHRYHILTASDGQRGWEQAVEAIPDIIISDVMMPEMDGFTLCRKLKTDERTSHIPVILLTAKADQPSRLEGLETGADAYLAKPFDRAELEVRLRKMMELRRRLQARYGVNTSAERSASAFSTDIRSLEDTFLQRLNDTILQHLSNENFGVKELSEAMHLSRMQLHRKIKALTGRTSSRYLRWMRLQKANDLLRNTELSISEVADRVGFRDTSYFSSSYREEFGQKPSETRD